MVSCPQFTNSFQAANGSGGPTDGFIRSASSLTSIAALLGTSSAIWESPGFTYNGAEGQEPDSVTFSLARKSDASLLLSSLLGSPASYGVELCDTSDSSAIPLTAVAEVR